eukprot:845269-Heterocapsa_arctica.AAC.1
MPDVQGDQRVAEHAASTRQRQHEGHHRIPHGAEEQAVMERCHEQSEVDEDLQRTVRDERRETPPVAVWSGATVQERGDR